MHTSVGATKGVRCVYITNPEHTTNCIVAQRAAGGAHELKPKPSNLLHFEVLVVLLLVKRSVKDQNSLYWGTLERQYYQRNLGGLGLSSY